MHCRYFATKRSNKSGSFVRVEKLRVSTKRRITLLQALQDKYERELSEAETSLDLTHRVRVELVGMAKLRQQRGGIERLQEVSLQDAAICSAVSVISDTGMRQKQSCIGNVYSHLAKEERELPLPEPFPPSQLCHNKSICSRSFYGEAQGYSP